AVRHGGGHRDAGTWSLMSVNRELPAGMTAAYVTDLGPAESIQVGELPLPVAGPTDVLVAVDAVAVNPVDAFIRAGRYRTPIPFPFVIGRDLVGTVFQAPA